MLHYTETLSRNTIDQLIKSHGYLPESFDRSCYNKVMDCYNILPFSKRLEGFYINPNFGIGQMTQILYGINDGLSLEQLKTLANPDFNECMMYNIRELYAKEDNRKLGDINPEKLYGWNASITC